MSEAITPLLMPRWGIDMAEGRLVRWLLAEGDPIHAGAAVLEVESEKTIAAIEATAAGTLRRRVAREGDTLPVGALLGVIAGADVAEEAVEAFIVQAREEPQRSAAPAAPREDSIRLLGQTIRYVELGEGPPTVVFVHGFGGSLESWGSVQRALARQYRTLSLDLPGHGASSKTLDSARPEFFVDLLGEFLQTLEACPAHLVGHSWGGQLVAALAARRPAAVASVTLIGSSGRVTPAIREFMDAFLGASRRGEVKNVLLRLFADPRLVTREMVELVLKYRRLEGAEAALRRIAAGLTETSDTATLPALPTVRAQIIQGEVDRLVPIDSGLGSGERTPVHRLENVGHMPHLEASSRVAELIGTFVSGAGEPAAALAAGQRAPAKAGSGDA